MFTKCIIRIDKKGVSKHDIHLRKKLWRFSAC